MQKEEAEEFYKSIERLYCPYFEQDVIFNSIGFYHLQYSAGVERKKIEQEFKFKLLKFVPYILQHSGTVQEYRKRDTEYWGFTAICDDLDKQKNIKVIVKRAKRGKLVFWSVMPGRRPEKK